MKTNKNVDFLEDEIVLCVRKNIRRYMTCCVGRLQRCQYYL